MGKVENTLTNKIRLMFPTMGGLLFRNNCGTIKKDDRWIKFGVANPGGSDLIGLLKIQVTPAMVGDTLAIFTACEVKGPNGELSKKQIAFLRTVAEAGGIAIVAKGDTDAIRGLRDKIENEEKVCGRVYGPMPSTRRQKGESINPSE